MYRMSACTPVSLGFAEPAQKDAECRQTEICFCLAAAGGKPDQLHAVAISYPLDQPWNAETPE